VPSKEFAGIFPYLVTPIDGSGNLKEDVLRNLVNHLISKGVHGLTPLGSTGEGAYFPWEVKKRVIDIVVKAADGRVPVIAGVNEMTTAAAVKQAIIMAARYADIASDIITTLDKTKTTCRVSANITSQKWFDAVESTTSCRWNNLMGYEIHMGKTTGDVGLFSINRLNRSTSSNSSVPDGSVKDNVWGTYIHGIFDNNGLRTALINSLRMKKGLQPRESTVNYAAEKERAIDRWADILKSKVDICFILRQIGMDACMKYFTKGLKCATKKL